MKTILRAILLTTGFVLAIWLLDGILNTFVFHKGTFLDVLVLDVSPAEWRDRLIALVVLVTFGLLISTLLTRRERTEGALQQSQRTLGTLMGNLPGMAYCCLNVEKRTMTFVSKGAAALTGYRPADLIDDQDVAYGDLIVPEDRAAMWDEVQAAVQDGRPYQITYRITTGGGEHKWVWEQGEAVHPPGGGPLLLEGFITDINARVQAEEALRESEERSRTTLYSIGDAVITTDNRGRVWQMNPVAEALTGWSEAEAAGKPLRRVFHVINEQTRAKVESPVERVLEEGITAGLANHSLLVARNGTERPIADSGAPIRDKDGEVVGVVLVFRDQTKERAAERAIRESEEKYRSLFDNMLGAFAYHRIVLDEEGTPVDFVYLDINDAFEQQTGEVRENLIGRRATEVLPGIEKGELIQRCGQVALTGEPTRFEQYTEVLDHWYWISAYSPQPEHFAVVFHDITERKQAEKALQASEQRYRVLAENAPLGIWQINPEGYTLYANPTMCSMLQVESYEELWDVHVSAFVSDEDYRKGQREVRRRGGGVVSEYVLELNGREGRRRMVHITGAPIFTPDGELHSSMGLVIDITERLQTEEALQASEERYRALAEYAPTGLWQLDPKGYTLYANPAMCALAQVGTPEDLVGVHYSEFFSGDSLRKVQGELAKRRERIASRYEVELVGREGRKRKVLISGTPIFSPDGELQSSLGLIIDITERLQAEEALQASEARYRALAENAPVGIWQLDPEGHTVYANPAMCSLLQIDGPEELADAHVSEFLSEEDYQRTQQGLGERRVGISSRYEVELIGREGRKRDVLISGAPIFSPDGELQSAMGMIIDITERKQSDEALRQSEALLAAFTSAMPDLGFILGKDGAYLEVVGAQHDLLAAEISELKGRRIHDVLPQEVVEKCLAAIRQALATREVQSIEYSLDVPAGHVWFEGRISPMSTELIGEDAVVFVARDITERRQAEEAERRQRLLAEALRDTAEMLHSTLELDEVLERILKAVEELVPHRGANIMLFDEDSGEPRIAKYCPCYNAHNLTLPVVPTASIIADFPPFSEIMRTRQPVIASDVREYPTWPDDVPSIQWIRAYLGVPILVDGEVAGFINLDSDEVDAYTPADAEVLMALATQAAVAIDSARLYEQARQQRLLAEALRNTAEALHSTLEFDEVLDRILEAADELVPHSGANIILTDEESGVSKLARYCSCYKDNDLSEPQMPEGIDLTAANLYRTVVQTHKPMIIPDTNVHPGWPTDNPSIQWIRSYLCTPIVVDGEIAGYINLDGTEVDAFTPDDAEALVALANQAAVAIDSARLYEKVRRQAKYLISLNQASSRVSRWGLDLDGVLQAIVTGLTEEIGLDFARIWLGNKEDESLEIRASAGWHGWDGIDGADDMAPDRTGRLAQIARNGKPFLTNQVQEDEAFDQDWAAEHGIVAFAGYPLKKDSHLMAILTIFHSQPLTDSVLDVMGSFVNQAAIAIENARLYEELEEYSGILEQAVAERTVDLERAKDQVESILNHSPDGIVLLKPDGTVETANRATQEMLGFTEAELVGRPASVMVAPSDVDRCHEVQELTRQHKIIQRAELLARRKDGTTFDAQAVLGPVVENDDLIGIVCSLRNITALKDIERIKDDFLATAAHELRTPLTSIRGFSELLITRDLDLERQDRYHHYINAQSTQLAQIIDDLLDISRLESGRGLDLNLQRIPMSKLINEVVQPFAETWPHHTFKLEVGEGGMATGDAFRLTQVIRNLVLNAVKYSPGGGEVTINTHKRDGVLEVSVTDEGIGMTESEQAHLFEKFYRADPTNTAGTGLGLVICKLIIEGHGGTIWAKSEPGVGSTFTFSLPLTDEE